MDATTVSPRESPGGARAERLERALEALRERFGPWIVYRLADARPAVGKKTLSTGALGLDRATGIGGIPRGRITELVGPPTCGKGTLVSHMLANAQHDGGFSVLIDADHSADLDRLQRCGVDLADLLLAVPRTAQEALNIACLLAASGGLDALVIASANSLVSGPLGAPAAFVAGVRRFVVELSGSPTAAVFLVHTDSSWRAARNPARALAHAATLRITCSPLDLVTHASGAVLGLRLRAEVTRNKLAPPYRAAEFEIRRDRGVHAAAEAFDLGLGEGLIVTGPGTLGYRFGDAWLGRGREPAVRALDADTALLAQLRDTLLLEGR